MPKVCFAISVKYNGVNYAPNTPFEALEHDVKALCAMGGWQIKEPKVAETGVNEPKAEQSEVEEPKAERVKEKPARTRRSKTKEA
jgi:hypothetical protein